MVEPDQPSKGGRQRVVFEVSTQARPDFAHPLTIIALDALGGLLESAEVKEGRATLALSEKVISKAQVYLIPTSENLGATPLTPARLEKMGAFQPILRAGPAGDLVKVIEIPGPVLDLWPFCLCWVRGRVIRSSDDRPVCGARVHICEVDRLPIWILKLPEPDVLRLRDDFLRAIRTERVPLPPGPLPDPPVPGPGPDPGPFRRPLIRLPSEPGLAQASSLGEAALATRSSTVESSALSVETSAMLGSRSPSLVRQALVENWKLLLPYVCLWPWWWWRLRCDEMAVVTTDSYGRFQWLIAYSCAGDHPDLYFWVEYDLGSGFETVHRPPLACWTHWNYPCGSEVVIRITDPRVPACDGEPGLEGKQVWVVSVGRKVSVGEIYTDSAGPLEGMVREPFGSGQEDQAFGGKLEPRVWFGRAALIAQGITHYLWSVRPLGGSETDWAPLNRQVIRHYTTGGGTAPVDVMGPEAGGPNAGRFRIRPVDPPAGGLEWLVADEREDLAAAHFVTRAPELPDPFPTCGVPDPDAGKYELKMELFDSAGARVLWEDHGIVLRVAIGEAPFGADPVTTQVAGSYHRITGSGGKTEAFRMVLHVDNSRCGATIDAISGAGVAVDPNCGVVTLVGGSPTLDVGFHAGRPGDLARFTFETERGLSHDIAQASAAGSVGDAVVNGFARSLPCHFSKTGIPASTFLGACSQAAFSEHLRIWALSQDGYGRLWSLDAQDVAAFMLTEPCPPCPPCEEGPGRGRGLGAGGGGSGGQGNGGNSG